MCRGWGFSGGASCKEPACQYRRCKRCGFDPWVGKIPWRRAWQPTPVLLPRESDGQRSLAGYSPQDRKRVGHGWSYLASTSHTCGTAAVQLTKTAAAAGSRMDCQTRHIWLQTTEIPNSLGKEESVLLVVVGVVWFGLVWLESQLQACSNVSPGVASPGSWGQMGLTRAWESSQEFRVCSKSKATPVPRSLWASP